MPLFFIFVVGVAVALVRRRLLAAPGDPVLSEDVPARLLGWAVGLLATQRQPWGQAMIGELDRLNGRARRWRFALGCVAAAVVLPPWGRAAAVIGGLVAVAAGAGGLAAYTQIHYRLGSGGGSWVGFAILFMILIGYVLAGSVLLRRPGVAGPGLIGGLLVAVAWMAAAGFTFNQWLNSIRSGGWLLFPVLAPIVVGAGATLWGGSAAVGRRAARLAAATAAVSVYLYGVLAVAVVGADGHDPSDGWTAAQVIADNLANQAVFYLMALPLMTATLGWAAAAATARLRHMQPTIAVPHLILSTSDVGAAPIAAPPTTQPESRPTQEEHPLLVGQHPRDGAPDAIPATSNRRRRWLYVLLWCAAVAVATFLVFLFFLHPRPQ